MKEPCSFLPYTYTYISVKPACMTLPDLGFLYKLTYIKCECKRQHYFFQDQSLNIVHTSFRMTPKDNRNPSRVKYQIYRLDINFFKKKVYDMNIYMF